MISQISHSKLTVWVWSFLFFPVANDKHIQANLQKAHSNLTVWIIMWALCEYGVSSHLHWALNSDEYVTLLNDITQNYNSCYSNDSFVTKLKISSLHVIKHFRCDLPGKGVILHFMAVGYIIVQLQTTSADFIWRHAWINRLKNIPSRSIKVVGILWMNIL